MDGVLDGRLAPLGDDWCSCPDAPWTATGAGTLLNHPDGCGFPERPCSVRAHRVTLHDACGREPPIRFCGCSPSGYSFDADRDWWVHYVCGWPTRAWFIEAGQIARAELLGIRPVTYHEFAAVPRSSSAKAPYARLTKEQKRLNRAWTGRWVWD